MIEAEVVYILLLRATAAGVVLAIAAGLCRGRVAPNVRRAGLLAAVSAASYLLSRSGLFASPA